MKSESETKWHSMMKDSTDKGNEKIIEDDYELEYDDSRDINEVINLD
jgi:hypothetical protein